jgi:hypothetical protein
VTGAVLERPAAGLQPGGRAGGDCPDGGGRVTLDERLSATLHAVRTDGQAECPVCHARMTPAPHATGAGGAECGGCGSRLT